MTGSAPSVIVVKLGGEVVAQERPAVGGTGGPGPVTSGIAELVRGGQRVVVVHGGGPQATRLQEQLGQTPRVIAGRRITDEATLDVMKMVVAGKLNVDLCSALIAAGARPVGLHGASACVIRAEKRPPRVYAGAGDTPLDLGHVGDVTGLDLDLLGLLGDRGYVPVLACLGAGADGSVYNINADAVANRVAVELRAASLFLVSDVRGVLRDASDPTSRIASLRIDEGRALIASGAITKGMIPKLEEAFAALAAGVRRIHVVGRLAPGELGREAHDPGSIGTVLVA